ncbi:MAG: glycosyltransferase family 2 protein [Pararhodobacter sp.]|nr:glycosyltransferase family 2 protein [Pararhodobacter sp.]
MTRITRSTADTAEVAQAARMSMDAPGISVIVPVYNVAAHVGACIDSLRAQSLTDFEALVIDDGSTDGSGEVALEAIAGDPRFRLIRQANRGLSGARNTGLEAARGEFIAFLDSDDQFAPGFLAQMYAALVADGGDWVACAITLCFPDGTGRPHSALHGSPDPQPGPARRVLFDDATAIARHFPSAWNKLYRRSLIGALRFREGTWFEDHEFFWALAARTRHMLYLPEPLYRHTRARPGQITGADDDRVFEQFAVLERLAGLVRASGAARADEGFARLASRLIHERAGVLRQPGRRARFLQQAGAFFDEHAITFAPFWDEDISAALGLVMRGTLPLSISLPTQAATPGAMAETLAALEAQHMPDFELLTDEPSLLAHGHLANGARVQPLSAPAQGLYRVALRPGDQPVAGCFKVWLNGMERLEAALGLSGFEQGRWEGGFFQPALQTPEPFGDEAASITPSGGMLALTPERALRLHPEPAARILRRDLVDRPGGGVLAAQAELLVQAQAAGAVAYFPFPALAVPSRAWPGGTPLALALAVRAARNTAPVADLPRGWEAVIFARGMQAMLQATDGRVAKLWVVARAALVARLFGLRPLSGQPVDRLTSPHLRRALGLTRRD